MLQKGYRDRPRWRSRSASLRRHPGRHQQEGHGSARPVVLSAREHVIALEARDRGILGMLLHYP
jgi:hypothetical protein